MEKNEFYVEFAGDGGPRYLDFGSAGYHLAADREWASMFETMDDAVAACQCVLPGSDIFAAKFSSITIREGENTVRYLSKNSFSAFPARGGCPSPAEIARYRKLAAIAGKISRPVDFKAQEEEHAAAKLPEMERSLIAEFAERCKMGFAEYGPVFLGKRNWGKELKEEALDGLFYALMAAKTMEKYGDFIKALEEASDDELSMDVCSPDPLKQATYLLKQATGVAADLAAQVADRDKTVSELSQELADSRQEESMNMARANHLAKELDRRLQERDNYRESCEKLRKENLDMRALMESALQLGSPRG